MDSGLIPTLLRRGSGVGFRHARETNKKRTRVDYASHPMCLVRHHADRPKKKLQPGSIGSRRPAAFGTIVHAAGIVTRKTDESAGRTKGERARFVVDNRIRTYTFVYMCTNAQSLWTCWPVYGANGLASKRSLRALWGVVAIYLVM